MTTEYTDEQRAEAMLSMLHQAEKDLGLESGNQLRISDRAQRILEAARHRPLETQLYRLAWFVCKKMGHTQH
jgi:hypothetical protein